VQWINSADYFVREVPIVIGYGGTDDSIMSVLEEAAFCEGGLFWCKWEHGDGIDDRVENLLRASENAYLVEIGGADSLLRTLWEDIERVQLPDPERIMERAREHRDMIKRQKDMPEDPVDTTNEGKNDEASGASRVWDARDLIVDENYEQAISILDQLIKNEEGGATAYGLRGLAKQNLDKYEAAIEDLNEAIDINSEDAVAYNNRGNAYSNLGEHERAIEDYDKAIELDPKHTNAYNGRGNAYRNLGEHERAIEDYDKAIEIDPEYTLAYNNRAESRLEMEAYDLANEDAQEAYELADDTETIATSLLLLLISEIVIDEVPEELEREYREICSEDFTTSWNFTELERWISEAELHDEKEEHIQELISLFKDHQ
jgi:tetratricopeptide (TPR) repeat protein